MFIFYFIVQLQDVCSVLLSCFAYKFVIWQVSNFTALSNYIGQVQKRYNKVFSAFYKHHVSRVLLYVYV